MQKMAKIDADDDDDSSLFMYGHRISGQIGFVWVQWKLVRRWDDKELTQKYLQSRNNGKGLGIAQTLYEQMKRNYSSDL